MRTPLTVLVYALLLIGATRVKAFSQADGCDIQELRRHQKEDRKALKLQQKLLKQTMRGHEHSAAERRQIKRQMRIDRKLLRAGQREAIASAKAQQKTAKTDPGGLRF